MKLERTPKVVIFSAIAMLILFGTHHFVFSYLALLLSLWVICRADPADGLHLLFFLMNMANIFKAGANSTSFFTYLILLYVARCMLCRQWFTPESVIFVIYTMILQLATSNFNILRYIKLVSNVLLIDCAFSLNREDFDREQAIALYISGVILSSCMAMLDSDFFRISVLSQTKELGIRYGFGEVYRFSGLDTDPNYYSVNVIVAMCCVVVFFHRKRINVLKTAAVLGALFSFAVMTYSKSAFLMTAFPICCLVYSNYKSGRIGLQMICIIGIIIGAVYLFSGRVEFLQIVLSRLSLGGKGVSELTTGRTDIWNAYFDFFLTHPFSTLFGMGIDSPLVNNKEAHNTYIQLMYDLGLIGSTSLMVAIRTESKLRPQQRNALNYSVGVCVAIMYMFLSELYYYDSVFHIILAKLIFNTQMDVDRRQNEGVKVKEG